MVQTRDRHHLSIVERAYDGSAETERGRLIGALVFDRTIAQADHNDLFHRPDFHAAMVEALARIE
jgi:hypothetical protein